ncbi:MAG: kelch repeat-containing protein [Planctomycetota bacterium]
MTRPTLPVRFTLVLATIGLLDQAQAQPSYRWQRVATGGPPARWDHTMTYDPLRQEVVMFGGDRGSTLADTWVWSGSGWSPRLVTGPLRRSRSAMVFDSARGEVILFGGSQMGTSFGEDTWAWDGTQWRQLQPGQTPPGRQSHALAYDAARGEVVLFGGSTRRSQFARDTWTWNGSFWRPHVPATNPPGRNEHAMVFDSVRGEVLMFGGATSSGTVDDTWAWDGTNWRELTPTTRPSARLIHSMFFDSTWDTTVVVGGQKPSSGNDVWWWDGSDWSRVGNPGPEPRSYRRHAVAFDAGQGRAVLFGGNGPGRDETWIYERLPSPWAYTAYGQSCGPDLTLSRASGSVPLLGQTLASELTNIPAGATGAFMGIGSSSQTIGPLQLPLMLDFMGMPSCWLHQNLLVIDPRVDLGGSGPAHVLAIPPRVAFAGAQVFLQAVVAVPGITPLGLITSNGAAVTIGE